WSLYFRAGIGYITQDTTYNDTYVRLAAIFRAIPHHEEITFASPDAGILPYYSGMKHLDVVGLNDNTIAHAKSASEVISIILHDRPDLIFIPVDSSGKPFEGGHGFIGPAYGTLQSNALQAGYKFIAAIPLTVYRMNV